MASRLMTDQPPKPTCSTGTRAGTDADGDVPDHCA